MRNKKTNVVVTLFAFTTILVSCSKSKMMKTDTEITAKGDSKLLLFNDKWAMVGYGYDATKGFMDHNSLSDAPIIDAERFDKDYPSRILYDAGTVSDHRLYYGATASEYIKELNKDNKASFSETVGAKGVAPYFSGSISANRIDQTIKTYSSKYSYAYYEAFKRVKRIAFTQDATLALLQSYLTPEFISNIATQDADVLVKRYGTHVLLDLTIGGRLRANYRASVTSDKDYTRKVTGIKAGLSAGLSKIGIDLNVDLSKEQKETIYNESQNRDFQINFYGGETSGGSITFDGNGQISSNTMNIGSWEASVVASNSRLLNVLRAIPIYEFITDPNKKSLVMAAVERHISESQIEELGEVPIYVYNSIYGGDHYFTPVNQPTIANGGYIREGISFFAFSNQQPGTVPIYVYNNTRSSDHYFTPDNQPTIGGGAYRNEGIAFYAYPTNVGNSMPVFVYNCTKAGDHYFTPENSPTIGGDGCFRNEGIAFYVPR